MDRITIGHVEAKVARVNRVLGYDPATIRYSTIGAVRLDRAYGGTKVVRICNEAGGVSTLSHDGYGTLRQAATFLDGMLAGIDSRDVNW